MANEIDRTRRIADLIKRELAFILNRAADLIATHAQILSAEESDPLNNNNNHEPRVIVLDGEPEFILLDEEPELPAFRRKKIPCEQMLGRILSSFSSLFSSARPQPDDENNDYGVLLLPPEPNEDNVRYRGFRLNEGDE